MTRSLGLACLLLVVGCDEKKDAPPAPAAPAAAPAAPAAAPAAPAAAPAAPAASPGAAVVPDPAKAMKDGLQAAAEAKGDTPCEQAYNAIDAMIKAMEKNMPPGGKKSGAGMPDKTKFVAGCKELPPQMQQCMVMSYAMSHQAECAEAQKKLDPATMAKVKAMMGK